VWLQPFIRLISAAEIPVLQVYGTGILAVVREWCNTVDLPEMNLLKLP